MRSIDGSTYDPFTGQLLFTAEAGNAGGVVGQPLKWSVTTAPAVVNYDGSMGKAGYEGIHNDKLGNLILVEDTGGGNVTDNGTPTQVKQPNSFVYRFVPAHAGDLTKGKLQALQISVDGTPIVFHARRPTARPPRATTRSARTSSPALRRSPCRPSGSRSTTRPSTAPRAFDANAAAKAGEAAPRQRR